jgi:Flp pilus assembly protein TadG
MKIGSPHSLRSRLIGRFKKSEQGTAVLEFAIVAPLFIALAIGALQLFVIITAQAQLQTSAETAGRQILVGAVQLSGQTQDQFKSAVCASIPALLKCSGLMVDVQVASSFASANTSAPTITYDNKGNVTNTWSFQPGAPGDIVVLRLLYQWPVVPLPYLTLANQSNGTVLLMATSVFKNEAFK